MDSLQELEQYFGMTESEVLEMLNTSAYEGSIL